MAPRAKWKGSSLWAILIVMGSTTSRFRFLIGSMWGACTPESFAAKAGNINQGMHKRSWPHQMRMVRRAVHLLREHS